MLTSLLKSPKIYFLLLKCNTSFLTCPKIYFLLLKCNTSFLKSPKIYFLILKCNTSFLKSPKMYLLLLKCAIQPPKNVLKCKVPNSYSMNCFLPNYNPQTNHFSIVDTFFSRSFVFKTTACSQVEKFTRQIF